MRGSIFYGDAMAVTCLTVRGEIMADVSRRPYHLDAASPGLPDVAAKFACRRSQLKLTDHEESPGFEMMDA
jgi:hypothetical protein